MEYSPAVASMSLGRAWVHKLPQKLDQATKYNFKGIEIFFEDLEYFTRDQNELSNDQTPTAEQLVSAATDIKGLCSDRNLTIIGLQPFMHYEGLKDRSEHETRISKLKVWFEIAKALGTDMIQIPANFLPGDQITNDVKMVVEDFQEVADMGLQQVPVIKFAYENLCWSTYFDTWEQGWELVEKVARPNFGLCLDTFNIAGRVYADPASPNGLTPNAEADMEASLAQMKKRIDVHKIFYVQVVDAEKMRAPLVHGHAFHAHSQPARMSWSRNARLFAGEEGGYLPVEDILRAIVVDVGYRGWVSMELFSRTMANPASQVPDEHARRASESWKVVRSWMDGWQS